MNKFLLVDNDTLMRVKKKIAIEGEIIEKYNPSANKLKINNRLKIKQSKLDVHRQCDRFLNDEYAEKLMIQDVVAIEKGHYKI